VKNLKFRSLAALAAGVLVVVAVFFANSQAPISSLPGQEASEEVLNIRGAQTLTGPCSGNVFNWCVCNITCGAFNGACTTPGANCTQGNFNGNRNLSCWNTYLWGSCTPTVVTCGTGLTWGCTNVAGGCLCTITYPPWNCGANNRC
jgi:hypothetical protein